MRGVWGRAERADLARSRRRAAPRLAILALTIWAVVATLSGVHSYRAGTQWRARAEALTVRVGDAEREVAALRHQLVRAQRTASAARADATLSENDVARLETRVQSLASEKAALEDLQALDGTGGRALALAAPDG